MNSLDQHNTVCNSQHILFCFRGINIKEEHPNSKEKRGRRKDDGKGRKREKLNNLIQVQLPSY